MPLGEEGTATTEALPFAKKRVSFARRLAAAYRQRRELILGLISVGALLIIWQIVVARGYFDEFFASKPSAIWAAGSQLVSDGTITKEGSSTLVGLVAGFGLSVLIGVPLGILIGWYPTLYGLCQPYIAGLNATPRVALYPLFIVWFGIGMETKIVIVFISALLPVLFNTISGVRSLDRSFIEVARCMGANDRQIFRTVALPASVPFIMTGLGLAVGHALLAVVIAELFISSQGLGALLNRYATYFQTDRLMFLILLIAAAGILLLQVVKWVEQRVDFWRPRA